MCHPKSNLNFSGTTLQRKQRRQFHFDPIHSSQFGQYSTFDFAFPVKNISTNVCDIRTALTRKSEDVDTL